MEAYYDPLATLQQQLERHLTNGSVWVDLLFNQTYRVVFDLPSAYAANEVAGVIGPQFVHHISGMTSLGLALTSAAEVGTRLLCNGTALPPPPPAPSWAALAGCAAGQYVTSASECAQAAAAQGYAFHLAPGTSGCRAFDSTAVWGGAEDQAQYETCGVAACQQEYGAVPGCDASRCLCRV